jgi:peptidoglycan/xylan/chitin deacetylase (PgdA/CDA1 family)
MMAFVTSSERAVPVLNSFRLPATFFLIAAEVTLLRESTTQVPEILDKFGFDNTERCA